MGIEFLYWVTMSIVRENLMTKAGYTPYCGNPKCPFKMPRTRFDDKCEQFICSCGFKTSFDKEFIESYLKKWSKNDK